MFIYVAPADFTKETVLEWWFNVSVDSLALALVEFFSDEPELIDQVNLYMAALSIAACVVCNVIVAALCGPLASAWLVCLLLFLSLSLLLVNHYTVLHVSSCILVFY